MTLIALGSLRSSPGVTTAALALAATWPASRAVVLEADPDGGVLAARLGVPAALADLAAAARARTPAGRTPAGRGGDERLPVDGDPVPSVDATPEAAADPLAVATPVHGLAPVVAAAPGAAATGTALRAAGAGLPAELACAGVDVLADVGRLRPDTPAAAIVAAASLVVVVARPSVEELAPLAAARPHLATLPVGLVLVGTGPYRPAEVGGALDVDVLGTLPHDPRAAAALAGGRLPRRSALARAAAALAAHLSARLEGVTP